MGGEHAKLVELRRLEAAVQALRSELGVSPAPEPQPSLTKREALLVEAERVAHLGSWTWQLKSGEIVWSDELYRILGFDVRAVEPSSERFFDAIHAEDRARIAEGTQRGLQTGVPETFTYRIVRPDGDVRQVRMEAAFVREPGGTITHVVGTVLDETDKLRAAALLARTVADLNQAQRMAGLGSWRWDVTQQRADWSEGMYHIFGIAGRPLPSEELFCAHVLAEDLERLRAASQRSVTSAAEEQLELRIVRDDGVVREVLLLSRAILDESGRLIGFHGVLQDISERRALEERVRHSQKMEAVGTLAGGVAHDFNNYLLILSGHVELLEGLEAMQGPAKASLDAMKQACERCATLTQQLLTLSRRRRSRPRRVDPAQLVHGMEPTLRSLLGATIALLLELEPQLAPVLVDPAQLDQILMNLAINARDAMPDGGSLTISLQNVPKHAAPEHAEWMLLSVRDTGCGIPKELQSRIFEPFFTTKPVGKGTGLGLAIVYGLAQEAGGSIEVESAPGQGSAFHVYLKPADALDAVEAGDAGARALRGRGERILLVEDVPDVRELVSAQLRAAGYEVLAAEDGEAALRLLETQQPLHAVVSDVVMPKMGGLRFFAELRARYPDLPCLLMTGYSPEVVPETGSELSMLRKPFSSQDLLEALSQHLRRRPPTRSRAPGPG